MRFFPSPSDTGASEESCSVHWISFSLTRRVFQGRQKSKAVLIAVIIKWWSLGSLGQNGGHGAESQPWIARE